MKSIKGQIMKLYSFIVSGKQKAITAFVIGGVGTYLAQNGFNLNNFFSKKTIWAIVVAVAAHLGVYYKKNK